MIVLDIPTKLGAIQVRRRRIRGRDQFEWRKVSRGVWSRPFRHLIGALCALTNAYQASELLDYVRRKRRSAARAA